MPICAASVPPYEGCQGRYAGQSYDGARWSHNALEAHPGQPGRRCHEHQQEGKRGNEKESPDRKAWGGSVAGARQAGVPPSSANGMGVGISFPVRQRGAPSCGRATTRSRSGVTAEVWAAWLSRTKRRCPDGAASA